jgi:hypothetical protein
MLTERIRLFPLMKRIATADQAAASRIAAIVITEQSNSPGAPGHPIVPR